MNYLADPGGQFASDTHRRVLGHLSYPDDNYAWSAAVLVNRMRPDVGTNVSTVEEMQSLLEDLERDGHAQRLQTEMGDVWKMTQQGLEVLAGPIANEPPSGAAVLGPAAIGEALGAATPLNGAGPPDSTFVNSQDSQP